MADQRLFLAVDVESSGLFPESGDVVLEVGVALVDAALVVVDETNVVIGEDPAYVEQRLAVDPSGWVRRTHTASGLLDEVAQAHADFISLERAEAALLDWLTEHGLALTPRSFGPMIGSSVHFDQRFLRREMPTLLDLCSHRVMDASSTREQARLWRPDLTVGEPKAAEVHRALPDIHDTLALLRYYRRTLFAAPGGAVFAEMHSPVVSEVARG